jgi:hypothetical protein
MKLQPESERRGCKGKNQMKNEKKNTWDREIGKKKGGGRENRKMRDAEGRWVLWGWGEHPAEVAICHLDIWRDKYCAGLLEILAAGLRADRICLRTQPIFPASAFKELQLIIEVLLVMTISSTPPKTLMLIHINSIKVFLTNKCTIY